MIKNKISVNLEGYQGPFHTPILSLIVFLAALPFLIFSIFALIKDFNYENFMLCLALLTLACFCLFSIKSHGIIPYIEKIILTEDKITIIYYKLCKKNKLVLNINDIKNFNVHFKASLVDEFHGYRERYIEHKAHVFIATDKTNYKIEHNFTSRNVIKNIFKIAKYIPNFTYDINPESLPVAIEDINKIAKYGNGLSITEFLKFMFTNNNVSKIARLETYVWSIILPLMLLFILIIAFINMNMAMAIFPYLFFIFITLLFILFVGSKIYAKNPIFNRFFNSSYDKSTEYDKYLKYLKQNHFDDLSQNFGTELQLCNEFINKNPKNLVAIAHRATLYASLKTNIEAIDNTFTELLNKYPADKEWICDYARCYITLKNYEKAEEILETYYKNLDKDCHYYDTLGWIYFRLNNLDAALESFSKAAKYNPIYIDNCEMISNIIEQQK